ncbi:MULTISPECIES: HD domain-containing phosphohydrolase [Pseudoalteromonas]|uniref:Two-component system response regulator n=1 Tax=Pseudoalteromonas amylolytica TaxID=1859457 RepID=A0A1S1MPG0_9GAMM|nr:MULTISPECIES: HD domain-containing phosphohydrolase [Pseudoalteromonas]OHU84364.1 two-component system response regulator [Pseudoalteromonas sp. JW3]OHU87097.1 two-component system response regulator [Pseudoalteromonas amylolytica]
MQDIEKLSQLEKRPAHVLLLDDEPSVLRALSRLLNHHKIQTTTFTSGEDALAAMQNQEFDVVISDMRMPNMDGLEFLTKAMSTSPDSQRMLLTGYADIEATIGAINKAKIHAYMNKPWENDHLVHAVKQAIDKYRLTKHNSILQAHVLEQNKQLNELNHSLEQLVEKRTQQIKQVLKKLEVKHKHEQHEHQATVELLYNFINANPYIDGKLASNIAKTCRLIAKYLKLNREKIETAGMAGFLAQVGLLAMDPALYKVPTSQLTDQQKKLYYTHPATAQLMLMPAQHLNDVTEAIFHQYEKYNGEGIPKGLKHNAIPICAQILAVARDYWQYMALNQKPDDEKQLDALSHIKAFSEHLYNPCIVSALEACARQLHKRQNEQAGSMQILNSEQLQPGMILGLPVHNHQGIMLLPKGHVFTKVSIAKLKQLEHHKPTPFRLMISHRANDA